MIARTAQVQRNSVRIPGPVHAPPGVQTNALRSSAQKHFSRRRYLPRPRRLRRLRYLASTPCPRRAARCRKLHTLRRGLRRSFRSSPRSRSLQVQPPFRRKTGTVPSFQVSPSPSLHAPSWRGSRPGTLQFARGRVGTVLRPRQRTIESTLNAPTPTRAWTVSTYLDSIESRY